MIISIRGTRASDDLDLIRGLAAILVLASHLRKLLLVSFRPGEKAEGAIDLIYRISNLGHESVIIFFVLSGFFVGSSVIRSVGDGTWSWSDYIQRRAIRLYVVLIPALFLTFACDRLALSLAEGQVPSVDTANAIVSIDEIRDRSAFATALGNLFFLQEILTQPFGSNTSLWSLSYEAWYYLVFPCFWIALAGRCSVRFRLLNGVVGIAALAFTGPRISSYFPIWLMGATSAMIPLTRGPAWARRSAVALSLGVFLAVLGAVIFHRFPASLSTDYVTAASFTAFMIAVLCHRRGAVGRDVYGRVAAGLAGFSFTLYAVHQPIINLCRYMFTYEHGWPQDLKHWVRLGLLASGIMIFAYALSLVTEAHTERVRRWFGSILTGQRPTRSEPSIVADSIVSPQ